MNAYHGAPTSAIISYTLGFVLSVLLTLAAYFSVTNGLLTATRLVVAIVGLAVAQLLVQLVFFLHLGSERKPRLNLMAFGFMALVIAIIVGGTLWIMHNLDTHMAPHEMERHMSTHEGI